MLDVCRFLKYDSIFHTIHLKETGKCFLNNTFERNGEVFSEFFPILNFSGGRFFASFYGSVIFDNAEKIQ